MVDLVKARHKVANAQCGLLKTKY